MELGPGLRVYRQKKDLTFFILNREIPEMKASMCGFIPRRWNIFAILCFYLAQLGYFPLWGEEVSSMNHSFKPLLDAEWKKTRSGFFWPFFKPAGVSWDYYVSPPFPAQWPPDADHRFFYYIYAMGHNPQNLSDGSYISAPWGRIEEVRPGNIPPKFIRLSKKLIEIGIQGVHPISHEEALTYEKREAAETYLGTLSLIPNENDKGAQLLREYFCTWCRHNGVIAEEIRKLHKPFFLWLGARDPSQS